jgi:MYXO-CTERM domain-containing protein
MKLSTMIFGLVLSAGLPFASDAQSTAAGSADQPTAQSTTGTGATDAASQPVATTATMDEDEARGREHDHDDSGKVGLLGLLGLAGLFGLKRRDRETDVLVRGNPGVR